MGSDRITFAECIKRAVWILFIILIGYLLTASIFSTCYLGAYIFPTASGTTETVSEHTFYIRDHFIQHIAVFLLFSFLLLSCKMEAVRKIFHTKYFGMAVCILAGIVSVLIVLLGQYVPKSDQKHVVEAAAALLQNDFSDLEEGGYLFICPHQMGIVIYFQVLSVLFGNLNYTAFQLINVIWIVLAYYILVKLAKILWKQHQDNYATAFLCLLFLPYLFYATFLYGTVAGVTFALVSFYAMFLFEDNPKIPYLLICGLSIGIATVLKSNYQIFLIAEVVYLLYSCFPVRSTGKKMICRKWMLLLSIFICLSLCSAGVKKYERSLNNGDLISGIPMTAYIAMGLQDGKLAPGFYNGYNSTVYAENNYDYDKADLEAKNEIKRIVSGYPQDITTSISFFVKKISAQWNNPTFRSLHIMGRREGVEGLSGILSGTGRYIYISFVNLLHTWILAGTFLYALLRFKICRMKEMLLPITFIGGFLFHLFWEANAMYAIPYFLLLLPLCICGYGEWRQWLLDRKNEILDDGWKSEPGIRLKREILAGTLVIIVVCALSYTEPFAKMFARNENTGAFDTYTQEPVNEEDALPEQ